MMKNSLTETAMEPILKKADYNLVLDIVHSDGLPLLKSFCPLEKRSNLLLKRMMDIIASSILIVFVLSWLLPIIALLIKIDSGGPVFFLQKRNKKDGHTFTCIKFRTMIVNVEADILPAAEGDHRITKPGRILRKYHLDEWPQLLNVWWGDMSLIGPRPHMLADNSRYERLLEFYTCRHRVKPGITGLAQVHGYVGSATTTESMKARVEKDIQYINNWSALLDLRIICQTVFKLLGTRRSV